MRPHTQRHRRSIIPNRAHRQYINLWNRGKADPGYHGGTPQYNPELPFVACLEAIGYEYKSENGVPERHFFGKGAPRTVHLNIVRFGGQFWLSHIAFREYLRHDRNAALEYERLKLSLAERFAKDRESYTNGKLAFVEPILARVGITK